MASTAVGESTTIDAPAPSPSDLLTTQEKLLLAQAVYKVGAAAWTTISQLLLAHPICVARPADTFSPASCEELYISLMTSIGQNVPAPDAMKPQNKIHLLLARTFYFARLAELKVEIEQYENRFTILIGEINAFKSGEMDEAIREEIKAATIKKYGPRVLQWIPDEGEVKKAIEVGPVQDGEVDVDRQAAQPVQREEAKVEQDQPVDSAPSVETAGEVTAKPKSTKPVSKAKSKDVQKGKSKSGEKVVEAEKQKGSEHSEIVAGKNGEVLGDEGEAVEAAPRSPKKDKSSKVSPRKSKNTVTNKPDAASESKQDTAQTTEMDIDIDPKPANDEPAHTPKPPSPASDLSPLPSAPTDTNDSTPKPVASPTHNDHATRSSKRKASTQPRGAPASKRGAGRPRRGTSPAATTSEHHSDEEAEPAVEPEHETEVEPEGSGRGRRQSKRHARNDSPPQSARTRGSSPATSRRAPSVSSNASTPVAVEEKRPLRGKARGMRDEVVSKSVREQSAAVESAKEEEDEAESPVEKAPTRSSRRGKKEPSPVEEKKEAGRKKRNAKTPTLHGQTDDDEAAGHEVEGEGDGDITHETASATPAIGTPVASVGEGTRRGPRRSEGKDVRATQKILYSLLDTIQGHQHGGVFSTGVKKSEAPDYHLIIKKPMDLKKIRQRIRDGNITNIDEFERDVYLMFANAMMYNEEGSQFYNMAKEMFRATENHIIQFRTMQTDIGQ